MEYIPLEKPIADLEVKIEELKRLAASQAINLDGEIEELETKAKHLRHELFSKLTPHEIAQLEREVPDWEDQVLDVDDLIQADDAFFAATGITPSPFLEGVHYDRQRGITTHSIVIRALSGSMRFIQGVHQLKRELIFGSNGGDIAVSIATS